MPPAWPSLTTTPADVSFDTKTSVLRHVSATADQRNSRSAHQLPANALHSAGCAVPGIHLANNRMNVIAGGGFSDVKGQADFTIRKAIADQTKHVVFTVR